MPHPLEAERPGDYLTRLAVSDFGRAYKSLVLDQMQIQPGCFVVDLGCGPGADLAAFADAVGAAGRVMGIDSDPAAVSAAAQAAASRPQVSVEHGDIHQLELEPRSVDRVHTDRVLQHVAEPSAVIAGVKAVLRPDGVACFAEPDWDTLVIDYPNHAVPDAYRRFITDQVVRNSRIGRLLPRLCDAHGLTVARVVPLTAVFRDVTGAIASSASKG